MRHATALSLAALLVFSTASLRGQDAETVYTPGEDGVTHPVIVKQVKPRYPDAALEEGKDAVVSVECVVTRKGLPTDVRVVESAGPDFDEEAVTALQQWEFKPGTKNGKSVAVRFEVSFAFTIGR